MPSRFSAFSRVTCQGGEERIHNELQHEFARHRNIVSDFRQVYLHQLRVLKPNGRLLLIDFGSEKGTA
jgi:hypothetical protein